MEDAADLQEWEFVSDSEADVFALEDIVQADYFATDSDEPAKSLVDWERVEPANGGSGLGVQEIEKGVAFAAETEPAIAVDSEEARDLGCGLSAEMRAEGDDFAAADAKLDVGFEASEPRDENSEEGQGLLSEISEKGGDFAADDAKFDVGCEVSEPSHQDSGGFEPEGAHDLSCDASAEMSSEGEGKTKVLAWWKLPLEIIKMCALRAKTVWTVPIAAAFIGILMVGRRLYKMKQRSRRMVALKVRFDDKATSQQLAARAARLNQVVVRPVPVVRSSPMLTASGVTSWPLLGLL